MLVGTPCWYQVPLKVCARLPGWRCWCGIQGCYSAVPVDSLWSPTKVSLFLLRWLWSRKSPKRSDQKKIKLQLKKRSASSWCVHIVSQPYVIVLVHIVLLGIVLHIVSLSILLYVSYHIVSLCSVWNYVLNHHVWFVFCFLSLMRQVI